MAASEALPDRIRQPQRRKESRTKSVIRNPLSRAMLHRRYPFKRWPLRHHVLTMSLVVIGVAAAGWWYVNRLQTSLTTLQHESQSLQGQIDAALLANSLPADHDFTIALPTASQSEDVVRDIGRFAQSMNVQITSLNIAHHAASTSELGQMQFNVTGQAQYKDTKDWIAELLGRYPALALQTLLLRVQANDPIRQEIRLTLVLIVKD